MMDLNSIDIKDKESLIAYGNDFFSKSAKFNHKQRRKWLLNILFIIGDQLCYINDRTGNIARKKIEDDPEYVVRVINNRIMPIYRTMVAKMTKSQPIPICTANSKEDKDVQASRACTKLMQNHWLTLELDEGIQEIVGWLVSCGNAFTKQFYNPSKGESISLDDEIIENVKQSIANQNGEDGLDEILGIVSNKTIPIGDTDLVVRSPFCVYPEPGKTKIKNMRIFGDSEFLSPEEVLDKYGIEVDPNFKSSDSYIFGASIGSIIDSGGLDFEDTRANMVEVREIYILPTKKFKNGITYKWVENKLIGKVEEECKEIPLTHFGFIEVPGKFWHEALITDLIPMQRRWNELLSKVEMHNDLYNDPPIIIDPNIIDIDEWIAKPGLILEKKLSGIDNGDPWVMPVPTLDQAIFQEINILDKQFEIVPVLNKVSFGKDTPNARSGLAINYLQEKDDDVIRPLISKLESSFTKVFKRDFKLCQKNYKEDRGFAIVGENNKVEWVDFMKANLTSNVDVYIEPGSAMPRSIAAQQAMILELMDRGFFVDPKTGVMDYARISRYMEFGGVEEMYEDISVDIDHARRCIESIKNGQEVSVQSWFNFEVHLDQINNFRKTTTYEDLDPEIQYMMDDYANQCEGFLRPLPSMMPEEIPSIPTNANPALPEPVPSIPSDSSSTSSVTPTQAPVVEQTTGVAPLISEEDNNNGMTSDTVAGALAVIKVLNPELWNKMQGLDSNDITEIVEDIIIQAEVETEI